MTKAGRAATVLVARPRGQARDWNHIMKGKKTKVSKEPIGIVIAGTPTPPLGTVFSAFVWGPPASTTEDEPTAN